MHYQRKGIFAAALILLMVFGTAAWAEFPERPITVINPQAPGGAHDAQGRAFAAVAEKYFGKPMVVVNKPGASTIIGTVAASEAAPDGYTLLLASTMTTTVVEWDVVNGKKPPVTKDDFVTIGSLTLIPTVISVPANSPWNTIDDMVKAAKAKQGFYAYCSAGLLSTSHLGAELFARAYGVKFRHVPFTGGGPCLSNLVGGHTDFTTQFTITTIPLAHGNKVRILASESAQRVKAIPSVPTLKELGANVENYMWVGLVAPKKTPPAVVAKLRETMGKAVKDPAFTDAIEKLGGEVHYMNGEDLARFWQKEKEEHNRILTEFKKEGLVVKN
ncbi:MAG TPA: tripartite tricarboxylate transporter substrate binding protein [Thermodesulfobacteriota bacterium]|nr:tripartite tricarboxylate transporter substrate binding protein [Thermodesulfobacteriota bacterium]